MRKRKRDDIVSYTDSELKSMQRRGLSRTDWKKVDAMTEEELEASIAADPDDIHEELDWSKAFKGLPPFKKDIHIRIDSDVLDWFKQSGRGYQTRMNNVLRAFFKARRTAASTKFSGTRRKSTRRVAKV
jgi:uncharacterized protein (DUF4415 family)